MKFYVSYFAQIRNFPSNMIGFSTAKFNPRWLNRGRSQNGIYWLDIPPLKPGAACDNLCDGKCNPKHPDTCTFLRTYRAQLDKLDFNIIINKIKSIAEKIKRNENFDDVDIAILVFEVPQNICSERQVIKEWFSKNGVEIEEWRK